MAVDKVHGIHAFAQAHHLFAYFGGLCGTVVILNIAGFKRSLNLLNGEISFVLFSIGIHGIIIVGIVAPVANNDGHSVVPPVVGLFGSSNQILATARHHLQIMVGGFHHGHVSVNVIQLDLAADVHTDVHVVVVAEHTSQQRL